MRKLELKFGDLKEMLTKEQMQKISGGTFYCGVEGSSTNNLSWVCSSDACTCQDTYDEYCLSGSGVSSWCSDVDCGCK